MLARSAPMSVAGVLPSPPVAVGVASRSYNYSNDSEGGTGSWNLVSDRGKESYRLHGGWFWKVQTGDKGGGGSTGAVQR